MTKQYVFWRTPEGRPHRGPEEKYAPMELLAEIGKSSFINDEGQVSWNNMAVFRYETGVRAAIVVIDPNGEELNEADAWSIVRSSLTECIKAIGGKRPIPPIDLITEANKKSAKHFLSPRSDYVLVTSLSVKAFPGRSITIRGCEITPLKRRGTRYPFPDVVQHESGQTRIGNHLKSTRYQSVRVAVSGRTIYEATDYALAALAVLRGFWSLFETFGSWSIPFGPPKQAALGIVHTGPIHTLHHRDGTLVSDLYWYEPDYIEDRELFAPKDGWEETEKQRRRATDKIRRHPYRSDLENLIGRYALALDQANLDLAFLQMWSILEKVTDTVGARYDETIRRAVWSFRDRQVAKELLEAVRFRRNQFVHAAKSGEDRDQIAYLIKSFIEPHLMSLIRNDFSVENLEEYGQHLALPTNLDALEKRLRRLSHATRIRRKWNKGNAIL